MDGLEACVRGLDPASRALLDLSLRRGMRDDGGEVHGTLGKSKAVIIYERARSFLRTPARASRAPA